MLKRVLVLAAAAGCGVGLLGSRSLQRPSGGMSRWWNQGRPTGAGEPFMLPRFDLTTSTERGRREWSCHRSILQLCSPRVMFPEGTSERGEHGNGGPIYLLPV